MSINRVIQSGNLTRNAELRRTQSDHVVLIFGLAVNERRRKPNSDEWEDVPNYIDCVVFGNRAEALEQYLVKGTKVAVEGRLRWSQWKTEDGSKRSKHELIVDELEFIAPRREEPIEVEEFSE
ncbi:MAG: single-stranded DNA-binding protein [Eggerthellaceae bacterium]|nr:single-stranded DNA-binding protein [Eggerthellaceae bacterium]